MDVLLYTVLDSQAVSICIEIIASHNWKSWLEGWISPSCAFLTLYIKTLPIRDR